MSVHQVSNNFAFGVQIGLSCSCLYMVGTLFLCVCAFWFSEQQRTCDERSLNGAPYALLESSWRPLFLATVPAARACFVALPRRMSGLCSHIGKWHEQELTLLHALESKALPKMDIHPSSMKRLAVQRHDTVGCGYIQAHAGLDAKGSDETASRYNNHSSHFSQGGLQKLHTEFRHFCVNNKTRIQRCERNNSRGLRHCKGCHLTIEAQPFVYHCCRRV